MILETDTTLFNDTVLLTHKLRDVVVLNHKVYGRYLFAVAKEVEHLDALAKEISKELPFPENETPELLFVSSIPVNEHGEIDVDLAEQLIVEHRNQQASFSEFVKATGKNVKQEKVEFFSSEAPKLHLLDTGRELKLTGKSSAFSQSKADVSSVNKPSYVKGEALQNKATLPINLNGVLKQAANTNKGIQFVFGDGTKKELSYQALYDQACRFGSGLAENGLSQGDHLIFQLENLEQSVIAFWATQLYGVVAVPLGIPSDLETRNADVLKLWNTVGLLPEAKLLCSNSIETTLMESADKFGAGKVETLVFEKVAESSASITAAELPETAKESNAVFLCTSGSTGTPKLVCQTHENLIYRSAAAIQMNGFTTDDVSLNWFPLDHVGGLVMFHLRDVFAACDQVLVDTNHILQQPLNWLKYLSEWKATITWAPNFAYGLINSLEEELKGQKYDLSTLHFVLNGGEAVSGQQAKKFLQLLEPFGLANDAMKPAWGMSETCSGVTYCHDFDLNSSSEKVAVGKPIPEFEIRVVDSLNTPVEEGTEGSIQVRGGAVLKEYYKNESANREAFTADGFFITGDLGIISNGDLTITGRLKNVIIINGLNYASHEIEASIEEVDQVAVSYVAALAIRQENEQTDQLAIVFHTESTDPKEVKQVLQDIKDKVTLEHALVPEFIIPVTKAHIPKTNIGKIKHEAIKTSILNGELNEEIKQADLLLGTKRVLPNWFYKLDWKKQAYQTVQSKSKFQTVVLIDPDKARRSELKFQFQKEGVQVIEGTTPIETDSSVELQLTYDWEKLQDQLTALKDLENCLIVCNSLLDLNKPDSEVVFNELQLVTRLGDAVNAEIKVSVYNSCKIKASETVHPTGAAISAFLKSWMEENKKVLCTIQDFNKEETLENIVLASTIRTSHEWVAYREGQNYVPFLTRLESDHNQESKIAQHTDGLHVITGGLGGVGLTLVDYLIEQGHHNILLVGRTELEQSAQKEAFYKRQKEASSLLYLSCDLTDDKKFKEKLNEVEEDVNKAVSHVWHLAGALKEGPVHTFYYQDFISSQQAKVQGTHSILNALEDKEKVELILFSSVNGYFGGNGMALYAFANGYLDGLAHVTSSPNVHIRTLSWSMWNDLGMSKDYQWKELTQQKGFYLLSPEKALLSIDFALNQSEKQLFIGLNESRSNIANRLSSTQLVSRNSAELDVTPEEAEHLSKTLLEKTGVIRSSSTPKNVSNQVESKIDVEAEVKFIWGELLNLDQVNATDNFFDLGGHSLLLPRLQQEVNNRLGVKIEAIFIFQYSTLASFTTQIKALVLASTPTVDVKGAITEIWKEELKLEEINGDDSFFDLGGHSLILPVIQNKMEQKFALKIAMVELFKHFTLDKITNYITEQLDHSNNNQVGASEEKSPEEGVMEIWKEVLKLDQVSNQDNFFDLGGHSLLVPQIQKKWSEKFDTKLEAIDLFKYPTISQLLENKLAVVETQEQKPEPKKGRTRMARRGRN